MTFHVTILYPESDGAELDIEYYTSKHMPLVVETWAAFGLKTWQAVKFAPGLDGSQPYRLATMTTWENKEGVQQAMAAPGTQALLADVANFTNIQTQILFGNVIGGSSSA